MVVRQVRHHRPPHIIGQLRYKKNNFPILINIAIRKQQYMSMLCECFGRVASAVSGC